MCDNRAASGGAAVTSLEDNVVNLVLAFLDRSPLNDGQFGRKAVGDGGFVANLRKGAVPKMDAADRALRFMGEPMIGPAFRAEIATFLVVTGTRGSTLGHLALGSPNFVHRLTTGGSPRLDTVQKVRAWMRRTASFGERAEIARAIADPGVPDPVLNPDPGAVNALAEGRPRADTESEGLAGKSARAIEEKILLTPTEAAAFLNLKPFTLSRYRAVGDGPAYCKLGAHVRYFRADLLAWAWARRQGNLLELR